MDTKREIILAQSLTANDVRLLPHLPYLLQDLWELGSDPQEIAALLRHGAQLDASSRVIDLGCGKGAVSIEVARQIGCTVIGHDLMESFIGTAREKAEELGVGHLCHFSVSDIVESVEHERNYDAVIFGAVGEVLGDPAEMLIQLRQVVRPSGYVIIDDAYSTEGDQYLTQEQWYSLFMNHGYDIVEEVVVNQDITAATNRFGQLAIERRVAELQLQFPDMADLFAQYAADQQSECDDLASWLQGVTWLLRLT